MRDVKFMHRFFVRAALVLSLITTLMLLMNNNDSWKEFAILTAISAILYLRMGKSVKGIKIPEESLKHEGKEIDSISDVLMKLHEPVFFAEHILKFKPFSYQHKLLMDESKRLCACMGRQTGKSTTIAAKTVHFAMTNAGTTTLVVSSTLRQSMLLFEKILAFVLSNKVILSSIAYNSKTRIGFKNGSWIIALPCGRSGATLRGYTASLVILDEAAFIPEEVISNVILPMIATTGGRIWMISTPFDKEHIFYRAFNDPSWSVYHFPSSINPLISKEFLEEQKKFIGEINYRQEYEAEFIDNDNAYFPSSLIHKCIDPEIDLELRRFEHAYAGYDPGGKNDPAALVILEKSNNGYRVVYTKRWLDLSYSTINAEVSDICKIANVAKLYVDQTGLGNPIIENMIELLGKEKVEGITLTANKKEEMMLDLRLLFEQKMISIPNDRELLSNLVCIEYERTATGYRFKHANGTHDDLAYALALASLAAKNSLEGVVIKL